MTVRDRRWTRRGAQPLPFCSGTIPSAIAARSAQNGIFCRVGWSACRNTSGMVLPGPTTDAFCRKTERVLLEADRRGGIVVLGRAAAIVLCGRPGAVHVRLDGPEEALVF